MKRSTRDLLICVSLANLALLGQWRLLLDSNWYMVPIQPSHFLAVVIASSVFAAVLWCGSFTARRSGVAVQVVAKWLFLQVIIFSIGSVWMYYRRGDVSPGVITTVAAVPLLLLAAGPRVHRLFATLLLACFPCAMFLGLRAAWDTYQVPPASVVRGSFAFSSVEGPRVLLLVFDEMSEYVAFEHRPVGVNMPAFDRLRREAFVATAAYPPGNSTMESMPALLTGEALKEVQPVSARELRIGFLNDGRFESLAASKTVFSDAHALGLGTTMIGWYHPYCSVVGDLDYCAHVKTGMALPGIYERGGLVAKILDLSLEAGPVVNHTRWATRRRDQAHRETHEIETSALEALVKEFLAKFRSGIAVVHLPVPHPPAIKASGMYFANLAAADEELAAIRKIMEEAGTWDGTSVIITSDHHWRTHEWRFLSLWTQPEDAYIDADKDCRVPFIVKLPGQRTSAVYDREFNTVLSRSMLKGVLTKQIKTPQAMIDWLDLHRSDAPIFAYSFVHTRQ